MFGLSYGCTNKLLRQYLETLLAVKTTDTDANSIIVQCEGFDVSHQKILPIIHYFPNCHYNIHFAYKMNACNFP